MLFYRVNISVKSVAFQVFEDFLVIFVHAFLCFPSGDVGQYPSYYQKSLYHRTLKMPDIIVSLHRYKDFIRKSGFVEYSDYNVYNDKKSMEIKNARRRY